MSPSGTALLPRKHGCVLRGHLPQVTIARLTGGHCKVFGKCDPSWDDLCDYTNWRFEDFSARLIIPKVPGYIIESRNQSGTADANL